MSKQINPNLLQACASYNSGKRGLVQLGSSRSGKTISDIDFFVWLCSKKVTGKTIFIVRATYASFKTTLYEDFNIRLPMFGIPSPFANVQERSTFKLFGNKFFLLGADNAAKFMGSGCDFLWGNEGMHIPEAIWHQLEMRCREFFIIDSNPEFDDHYIFNSIVTRPEVDLIKTTYKDNPFCPPHQKAKIEGYEPWLPGSYETVSGVLMFDGQPISDRNQPPPHPTNLAHGTADEHMWRIFGLGEKAERKGRIFKTLYRYTDLPPGAHLVGHGMDYGNSPDPTAGVKIWKHTDDEGRQCLYIKQMIFGYELGSKEIADLWEAAGLKTHYGDGDADDVVVDTNEGNTSSYLSKERGFRIWRAIKGPGSVLGNIRTLQSYRLYIHEDSKDCYKGFENYCWEWNALTDASTGQPMKKFKHFPDSVAYPVVWAFGQQDTSPYDPEQ